MRRSWWASGLIATALSVAGCDSEVPSSHVPDMTAFQEAALAAEWAAGVAYSVGTRVTYQGRLYECRQAHTSQADWTPVAVAALWLDLGPAGGGEPDAGSGGT
ncbi:carbohydrate-binding protein, partial [Myxococcus vastator]|uniref:carbohydrate-binding protein n=1 Tax=Myxococcus vastator TaxID=2709664 RepID=UPI00308462AF